MYNHKKNVMKNNLGLKKMVFLIYLLIQTQLSNNVIAQENLSDLNRKSLQNIHFNIKKEDELLDKKINEYKNSIDIDTEILGNSRSENVDLSTLTGYDLGNLSERINNLTKVKEADKKAIQDQLDKMKADFRNLLLEKHKSIYATFFKDYKDITAILNSTRSNVNKFFESPDQIGDHSIQKFADQSYFKLLLDVNAIDSSEVKGLLNALDIKINQIDSNNLDEKGLLALEKEVKDKILILKGKTEAVVNKQKTLLVAVEEKVELHKKSQTSSFGAMPNLTSVLGSREIYPNISLLGNRPFQLDGRPLLGEIRLFTSAISNSNQDTSTSSSSKRMGDLYVSEASSFGILMAFTMGIWTVSKDNDYNRLGLNVNSGYLGKVFTNSENSSFTVGTWHNKIGLQFQVIKNILSFYTNYNTLVFLDNLQEFEENYHKPAGFYDFFDIGFKTSIALSSDKNSNIFLNLNFIGARNEDIQRLTPTKDRWIPNLKVGFRQEFGF